MTRPSRMEMRRSMMAARSSRRNRGPFADGNGFDAVEGARHAPLRTTPRSLGSFIGGFKAATTRQYREVTGEAGGSLWQRGYYEHVVRDDRDFARIGGYIANNPTNWALDHEHEHDAGLKSSNDASS